MTAVFAAGKRQEAKKTGAKWHWLWVIPVIALLAVAAFSIFRPIQVLPRITLAPGYSLTDQNGEALTSEDMRGKITLYTFTYTNCTEPCVQTTGLLQEVQARLNEIDNGDVPIQFVTISVDPEHDTTAVLTEFANQLGADPNIWHFVTGDVTRLKWVIGGGFGLYFGQRDDGSIILDSGYTLVDGAGIIRADYRLYNPDVDIILRDLRLLVEESQNSEGAARYAYEAAHLFLCYPR